MKKSCFTESQIAGVLRQAEGGLPVVDQPFGHRVPCNGFCGEELRCRQFPSTMYGWLPRDEGDCDVRHLVGCGHVFGVSSAVFPRALMSVRVWLGSRSMARA